MHLPPIFLIKPNQNIMVRLRQIIYNPINVRLHIKALSFSSEWYLIIKKRVLEEQTEIYTLIQIANECIQKI